MLLLFPRPDCSTSTQPWLRFLKTDFGTLPRRLKDSDLTFPAIGSGEAPLKNASARPLFAPGLDRSYAHEKFPDTRPYDLYTKLYSETVCGRQLCSKKISAVGGYQVRKSGMKEKRELRERRRGGQGRRRLRLQATVATVVWWVLLQAASHNIQAVYTVTSSALCANAV